jgi:hypothetical protein
MMAGTCPEVLRALEAYADDELPGASRLVISEHLEECLGCASELSSLRGIGEALRLGSEYNRALSPALAGLASGVTSRIHAEQAQSWRALLSRMFEDWHWVAVGLGSMAGALITFVLASTMVVSSITQLAQMNARAGTLYIIALPESGRGVPIMLEFEQSLGSAQSDARRAVPASIGWQAERALVSALDEALLRSGRPASLVGLSRTDREEILALLQEIADFRDVAPARRPGGLTNVSGIHLDVRTSVTASGI